MPDIREDEKMRRERRQSKHSSMTESKAIARSSHHQPYQTAVDSPHLIETQIETVRDGLPTLLALLASASQLHAGPRHHIRNEIGYGVQK